eukprot:9475510-Pyramimonas_sp.AAC.1
MSSVAVTTSRKISAYARKTATWALAASAAARLAAASASLDPSSPRSFHEMNSISALLRRGKRGHILTADQWAERGPGVADGQRAADTQPTGGGTLVRSVTKVTGAPLPGV